MKLKYQNCYLSGEKTKSPELAELICNKLLYQNGKYNDEDIDLMEKEIDDLEKEKRELLYGS